MHFYRNQTTVNHYFIHKRNSRHSACSYLQNQPNQKHFDLISILHSTRIISHSLNRWNVKYFFVQLLIFQINVFFFRFNAYKNKFTILHSNNNRKFKAYDSHSKAAVLKYIYQFCVFFCQKIFFNSTLLM